MSATGSVNDSAAAIMRLTIAGRDERAVLSSRVVSTRKATRYRASSVVVRRVEPTAISEYKVCHRALVISDAERWASTQDTVGRSERITVVRPGGRLLLSDMHRK